MSARRRVCFSSTVHPFFKTTHSPKRDYALVCAHVSSYICFQGSWLWLESLSRRESVSRPAPSFVKVLQALPTVSGRASHRACYFLECSCFHEVSNICSKEAIIEGGKGIWRTDPMACDPRTLRNFVNTEL
jgi:hypothetical protein